MPHAKFRIATGLETIGYCSQFKCSTTMRVTVTMGVAVTITARATVTVRMRAQWRRSSNNEGKVTITVRVD